MPRKDEWRRDRNRDHVEQGRKQRRQNFLLDREADETCVEQRNLRKASALLGVLLKHSSVFSAPTGYRVVRIDATEEMIEACEAHRARQNGSPSNSAYEQLCMAEKLQLGVGLLLDVTCRRSQTDHVTVAPEKLASLCRVAVEEGVLKECPQEVTEAVAYNADVLKGKKQTSAVSLARITNAGEVSR